MKKLFTFFILTLFIVACKKDHSNKPTYDEKFQVSFKFDGKEYSKVLEQDELNARSGIAIWEKEGKKISTDGPLFQLDNGMEISIRLGLYLNNRGDNAGNFERMKQLLLAGNKDYKCLTCVDTSIRNAVEITVWDRNTSVGWNSMKTDLATHQFIPITNEQNGSSFVVTEIKEATLNSTINNAFIFKGTFNCNLYDESTGDKKVLTDGQFTCILNAF